MKFSGLRKGAFYAVFEADKGAGSGGGTGDGPGDKTDDQKLGPDGKPIVEDKPSDKPNNEPDKKFTQADLDNAVKDRLKREKDKTDRESKEKQGEFEKLYNELKPQHETLTTERDDYKKKSETYSGLLETNLKAQMKDWPKEVTDLYPASASIEDRMAWVEKSAALAKRLTTQKAPVNGQHGKQGEPGGAKKVEDAQMGRYQPPQIPGVTTKK